MITFPRHLASLALIALLGILLVPRFAVAEERSHVRITGRVVDKRGVPLRDTWVVTQGSRRTGALTNASGRYVLEVVGGTRQELAREPLMLRIQAQRKGWRLAVPGGAPELAVELRIVNDSLGGSRFQVRSNDARVAAMLANDAVLQSGTRVALQLDFVGVRGVPVEAEVVDLTAFEEVVLAAPRPPTEAERLAAAAADPALAPLPATPPSAVDDREPIATAPPEAASGERARPRDPVSELLEKARAERAAALAPPVPDVTRTAVTIPPAPRTAEVHDDRGAAALPRKPAAAPRRPATLPPDSEPAPPIRRAAPSLLAPPDDEPLAPSESERVETSHPAPATDVVTNLSAAAEPASEPRREEKRKKPKRGGRVRPAEPDDAPPPSAEERMRELERPRVVRPGDPEAQAADVEKRAKRRPRARAATAEEIRRALEMLGEAPRWAPAPAPPPAGGGVSGEVKASRDVVPPPATGSAAAPTADATASGTSARPEGAGVPPASTGLVAGAVPSESAVAVTPARAAAPPAPPRKADPSCRCRIAGTVEVASDDPLPERVQVDVSLAEDPSITHTVELFMGSPRLFELANAPCGAHTLRLVVRSKLKFRLSAPLAPVDCSAGGYRQTRIVLEPLQKKLSAK